MSSASYDYIKICVNELKCKLRDADTMSNRKLLQSAIDDRNTFVQSGQVRVSQERDSGKISTASVIHPLKRHNPFDDDSFDQESIDRDSVMVRSFTEMHEDFRKEIKDITSLWVKNHPNSVFAMEYTKKHSS